MRNPWRLRAEKARQTVRDRMWILAGLALFVAVVATPFWYARTSAKNLSKLPDIVLPAGQRECIAPVSMMRTEHMQMLVRWRDDVVRHGDRKFVAFNGKVYDKSLTGTCLGCHNKEQFCDRCHAYSGVSTPSCWNCHNEPQVRTARSRP